MPSRQTRKRQFPFKRKLTRNQFKHDLIANNYIESSFKKMTRGQSKEEKENYLYYLVRYCYSDFSILKCKELTKGLASAIENSKSDRSITNLVYTFVKSVKASNIEGYPISNEKFLRHKVKEIENTITKPFMKEQRGKVLVDVGAGDCALSKILGEENDMKSLAIDIKADIDWGSASGSSSCSTITHVYYDGSNLTKSIRDVVGNSKVGIVMYNHSLHHFGSVENIRNSLKQAYELLDDNGILFLREHDKSKANDIDINLQHIFLSLRYTIEHYTNWDKDQIWTYMDNFIKTYTAHFLTKTNFLSMCKSIGFKPVSVKKRTFPYTQKNFKDISMTTLFAFKK